MNSFIPDKGFRLSDFTECEQNLKELGVVIPQDTRITSDLITENKSITLGDFLISSSTSNPRLYTTDNPHVFGRAPLPYTPALAWFEGHGGLAFQMSQVVELSRLQNIKQLSLLSPPVHQNILMSTTDFHHTRFLHTYDVYAIGMLCAHNVGVHGKDLLALRIALIIHDLFTPACGDLMKFVDHALYDEDALLTQLLNNPDYVRMCRDLGVEPEEPIRICQEKKGVLCAIRDFADTIAYTARDLSVFAGFWGDCPYDWYEHPEDQLLLERIWKLQSDRLFTLWEDVRANENGELVFADAQKLHQFLYVRACLFRILYYNRQTRNIEYLLGIRLVKMLLGENFLNHGQFSGSKLGDVDIWWKVYQRTGYNPGYLHNGALGQTFEFHSLQTARDFVAKTTDDKTCGLIYQWPSATKSKVGYWKVMKDGLEMPWSKAYPEQASEIEETMTLHKGFFVAIFHRRYMHQIKDAYWHKLKQLEQSVL
jgi:hypothetical protein